MLITSACVFVTLWLLSTLGADSAATGALYVPVFGPFLQIASGHTPEGNSLLLLDGVGQAAGAIMLAVGATTTTTVLVRNDLAEVRVAPMVSKEGTGLGLVGRF